MIRRTGYYIKEGFLSIFSHGIMSFATVGIIVACLIIMGSFGLLAVNINENIERLNDENHLLAYVNDTYTLEQAQALEEQILAIENVKSVEFITNEQAMNEYFSRYEDKSQFDGFTPSDFRHRFVVYLNDNSIMSRTQKELNAIMGIVKVNAHLELANSLLTAKYVAFIASLVIAGVLLFVSLFIMSNTVKLTTFERRGEIAIMKMVGATSGFIRGPFVFEGMLLGTIGALTAYIAQWGIYLFAFEKLLSNTGLEFITIVPFSGVALYLLGGFCLIGLGIGIFGSSIAMKNYLKG